MRVPARLICAVAAIWLLPLQSTAQTTDGVVAEGTGTVSAEARLSAEELQKLVAPVALYPDTVLIQVLIAATAPMDVVLADRLLSDYADLSAANLEARIKARKFDLSVEVLAIAFPDLIRRMATHIDWTDVVGAAMLAQSDDVLAAVQVMRSKAINSGALVSTPEVTVSTSSETNAVVVQPTNPTVVYVPQYDPGVVYTNPVGTAIVTGLVVYGTVALIDEIFDDNDDWDDYWGCRNCADWDSGTVIRNPEIDIDVNGDVIIGNDVNIGSDLDRSIDGRWQPAEARRVDATSDLSRRRGTGETAPMGIDRAVTPSDELRSQLGQSSAGTGSRTDTDVLSRRTPNADTVKAPDAKAAPKSPTKSKSSGSGIAKSKPKIAKTAPAVRTKAASQRGEEAIQRSSTRRRP